MSFPKGGHHSLETRAKMSAARMGKEFSTETRAKLSAARLGRKHSPGTRAKISAAQVGKVMSADARAKMSAAKMGNTCKRGPNYRTGGLYCAGVYASAWGSLPVEECGHAYNIHHRDGNRQNDDPENLIALTNSEHTTLEAALRRGDWDLAAEIDAAGMSRRHPRVLAQWKEE